MKDLLFWEGKAIKAIKARKKNIKTTAIIFGIPPHILFNRVHGKLLKVELVKE
jgi:hypothetical protein